MGMYCKTKADRLLKERKLIKKIQICKNNEICFENRELTIEV